MKRSSYIYSVLVSLLFMVHPILANKMDSVTLYDVVAEEAFFNGEMKQAIRAYTQALSSYWLYRDSLDIEHLNERIRLVERLAVVCRETGECNVAMEHFKSCFQSNSDKQLIAKVIHKILRCKGGPITIEATFKEKILSFFMLHKIDHAAHIQLSDLLNGAQLEEEELINFFYVLEKGFAPAIEAMNEQEKAQSKFNIMSFVSFSTILVSSVFGFIAYILKKKKDHIQQEKIALLKGKERETDRLSTDLHDILGYKIVELKDQIKKIELADKQVTLHTIEQGLDELHQSMRYIVQTNLTPQSLKFGLAPALETLINRVNQLGVLVFQLYKFGLEERLPTEKEKHIFYIIQELINNIIKHSKGRTASIEVTQSKKELTIMAEDNGIGYQPSINTLKTIKSRVEFLKGTVIEDSQEEQGAMVIVTIPI